MSSPTSTSKYVPPQRRQRTPENYLTYPDLHARFSPPNSPRLYIPRIRRSLSIEDLHQRFKRETHSQNSPNIPAPPLPPRDLEVLRHRSPPPRPPSPPRQLLSIKLPNPPVFTSTNHISFDDWKLRVKDKLRFNANHYPSDAFQVAYIVTRLGGEAVQHTLPRRRSLTRSYLSANELLDHLSDLYETPLEISQQADRRTFRKLRQGNQLFPEFYKIFMKYGSDRYDSDNTDPKELVFDLQDKVNIRLRKALACCPQQLSSLPALKQYLTRLDHHYNVRAEEKANEKTEAFARQYAKAKAELEENKRTRLLQRQWQQQDDMETYSRSLPCVSC